MPVSLTTLPQRASSCTADFEVQLVDDVWRRACRRHQGQPDRRFVARHTGFLQRGNVRQLRYALGRRLGQRLQATRRYLRQRIGYAGKTAFHHASHQIGHGAAIAFVRHMDQLGAGHVRWGSDEAVFNHAQAVNLNAHDVA